jgi:cytochrome oxidase Cu insertion factor (SCO1/SenC/PrrC family)
VNSAGTIKANLKIKPQTNGVLVLEISLDPDADDRPGNFVKDYVAPLFRDAIDNTLEQFTNSRIVRIRELIDRLDQNSCEVVG